MTLEKLNLIGKNAVQTQDSHSGKIDEIVDYINDNVTILSTKIHLTTEDILTGASVPVLMIPAPGVGKAIEIISAAFKLNFVTTAFSGGGLYSSTIFLKTEGASEFQGSIADAVSVPESIFGKFDIYGNASLTLIENAPVYFGVGTNSDAGDGNADVYICYRIIDL